MKSAFLFPGQGAQFVGMGADIVQAFASAGEIFEKANNILGFDLSSICFDGPAEQLSSTTISQPAIFVTSAVILNIIRTNPQFKGLTADVMAGLSLGEYTALYAAGVISFEDALVLVQKRGQAMQAAADETDGAMVSIIGLDEGRIRQLCAAASDEELLVPVNFNCPGQIVISGTKAACARAKELAPRFGAIKAVRLEVAGAFHTKMMSNAAEALSQALSKCNISEPSIIKTIANINAEYYNNAKQVSDWLTRQLTSPILWQKCIEKLFADRVEKFYEIGPGRVLTGLMRRINRKADIINISSIDSINELTQVKLSGNPW